MTSGALRLLLLAQHADAARIERKAQGGLRRGMQPFAASTRLASLASGTTI